MRIHLENFRCHVDATFDIPDNNIIRIKSVSGTGKTTIFEALYWLLYGRLQNITNLLADPKSSSKVTLTIDDIPNLGRGIKIYRQNHPNRLILTIENPRERNSHSVQYEDAVAQQIINTNFGIKNMWSSISYLRQGSSCVLLYGSKNERYNLLQELASQTDNPSESIERIDAKLKRSRADFRDASVRYETEYNLLQDELTKNPLWESLNYSQETKQFLVDKNNKLSQEYNEEMTREQQRQQLTGRISNLQSSIDRWQEQVIDIRNELIKMEIIYHDSNDKSNKENISQYITLLTDKREQLSELIRSRTESLSKLEKKLEQEEKSYHEIMSNIQTKLRTRLNQLTKQYNEENEKEGNRQQLRTLIDNSESELSNIKRTIDELEDKSKLEHNLMMTNQQINKEEAELRSIQDEVARQELNQLEKLKGIDSNLEVASTELNNFTTYRQKLQEQITVLNDALTSIQQNIEKLQSSNYSDNSQLNILKRTVEDEKEALLPDMVLLNISIDNKEQSSTWPTSFDVNRVQNLEQRRSDNEQKAIFLKLNYNAELPQVIQKWKDILVRVNNEHSMLTDIKLIMDNRLQTIQSIDDSYQHVYTLIDSSDTELSQSLNNWKDSSHYLSLQSVEQIKNKVTQYINIYRETIGQRKTYQYTLTCPTCQEQLKLRDGSLIKESFDPRQMRSELSIDQLETIVSYLDKIYRSITQLNHVWVNKITSWSSESTGHTSVNIDIQDKSLGYKYLEMINFEEANQLILEQMNIKNNYINQVTNYIDNISNIEWMESPEVNSKQLSRLVKLKEDYNQIERYQKEIENRSSSINEYKSYSDKYQQQLNECKKSIAEVETKLSFIRTRIDQLSNSRKEELKRKEAEVENSLKNLKLTKQTKEESLSQLRRNLQNIELSIQRRKECIQRISKLGNELGQRQDKLKSLGDSKLNSISTEINEVTRTIEQNQELLNKYQLESLRRDIKCYNDEIVDTSTRRDKLDYRIDQLNKLNTSIYSDCEKLTTYCKQKDILGENRLGNIQSQIETINNQLREVERGLLVLQRKNKLKNDKAKLNKLQVELAALEEMRQLAERVQYRLLEETIASVNMVMNMVFQRIFDDEIRVEFKMFRELKSKKRTTPHVNCDIYYKGAKYTSPALLSGGEKNRLNLGMIIALNLISSSPIIILDECTNFLDSLLRARCIAAIRDLMDESKTVLIVCHDDNDANYDHIVPIVTNQNQDVYYPIVDKGERTGL